MSRQEHEVVTPQDHQVTVISADDRGRAAEDAKKANAEIVREFMVKVRARWAASSTSEDVQRRRSLEEVLFNSGKHWDPDIYKERTGKERICLEVNRTPQYLNQVSNEEKLTRPTMKFKPVGNGDKGIAQVKQNLARSIERRSGAQGIRDDAFYRMLEKGWAYWRVSTDWESDKSFDQVIKTDRIFNDFSVYRDPNARQPDKSDAKFYFITEDMPYDDYMEEHGDSNLASLNWTSPGDEYRDWVSTDGKMVRVAEYYYVTSTKVMIYKLADGSVKYEDETTAEERINAQDKRWTKRKKVFWCKVNGGEILDGNDDLTAGRETLDPSIPIVFLGARTIRVEDKDIYVGMVRDAMEPCLASDYWLSAITEMVALAPKAPWLASAKAIAGYETEWQAANVENYAVLHYNHVDENGQEIPEPKRNFAEPPIQAMTFILRYADEDLKRVMGIYNAALGAPGPETSGVAIRNRQSESDVANYNYQDSLQRAIAYEAFLYNGLIRKVYDEERTIELTRADNTVELVAINKLFQDKAGKDTKYDMTMDDCTTEVEVGPSMNTKRQEAAANMTDFLKIDPSAAPLVGDLIARNMDFPDSEEFERRLKSRVPEDLRSNDLGEGKTDVSPEFKAAYQKQAQALEMANNEIQQLTEIIKTKQVETSREMELLKTKLASQEKIAGLNNETQITLGAMKDEMAVTQGLMKMVLTKLDATLQPGVPASAAPTA